MKKKFDTLFDPYKEIAYNWLVKEVFFCTAAIPIALLWAAHFFIVQSIPPLRYAPIYENVQITPLGRDEIFIVEGLILNQEKR